MLQSTMRIQIVALTLLLRVGFALGAEGPVVVLSLNDAIGPATADYIHRNLERAAEQQAQLVVLKMDTPGGLDTSMRAIIKDILASPIPVATFVAPSGARAASAGTYILYASHVAAMAPATNLGAATPISIGGMPGSPEPQSQPPESDDKDEEKADQTNEVEKDWMSDASRRKAVFDAAAYIRGLAQLRGRNAEWAEKAVREAVSLSAEEALKLKVIDLVAEDLPDVPWAVSPGAGSAAMREWSHRGVLGARATALPAKIPVVQGGARGKSGVSLRPLMPA